MKVDLQGKPLKETPSEIVIDEYSTLSNRGSNVELWVTDCDGDFIAINFDSFEELENTYKALKLAIELGWLKKADLKVVEEGVEV